MTRFREIFRHFGLRLVLQHPIEEIPPEVTTDLGKFLVQRRAYTDSWFFLMRVVFALGVIAFMAVSALLRGEGYLIGVFWVSGYVVFNIVVHLVSNAGFQYARWGYAGLDFFYIMLLRHHFQLDALLDPNATMIGLFSLLLVAYVHYSDIRLTSVMVVVVLVVTVLTLWVNVLFLIPQESPLMSSVASYYAHPIPALLLLSYLGSVSVITHRLVHRLYAQLMRFSLEEHKRTKAAVVSAVERSRRERLEELNQLKHNFITVISHELRNPITPLLSSLDILKAELGQEGDSHELLGIARESAGRIQRIITDYTKLAELITLDDESLLRWNVRLTDMIALLQEQTAKTPRLLGRFEDLVVCTDPRLLGGALLALMRRAEMLTPSDALITLRGYRENGSVIMSIHDPASFLEEQAIASLDDPFALSDERAFSSQNTGLELILARHSIRRLGGALQIDSAPDRGTTVHCTLPGKQPGARWLSDSQLRQELGAIGM